MNRLLLLAFLPVLVSCSGTARAQTEDAGTNARAELRQLERLAAALPTPIEVTRRPLPPPSVEALELARRIAQVAKLYDEPTVRVPFAGLLAQVLMVNADAPLAVRTLRRAAGAPDSGAERDDLVFREAGIRAKFGDLPGAVALVEALLARSAESRSAAAWEKELAAWQPLLAQQKAALAVIEAGARGDARAAQAATRRAYHFAMGNPLSPSSALFLRDLAAADDAEGHLVYVERLALFCVESSAWLSATREALQAFVREGEYEKALFYAYRLLDRSEILAPGEAQTVEALAQDVQAKLTRIRGRNLEVRPLTKAARLADLQRRASRRADDGLTLAEMVGGFAQDYPFAAELPELRATVANAIVRRAPDAAMRLWREILRHHPESRFAYEALVRAAPLVRDVEGTAAAEKLLALEGARFTEPTEKIRIALDRATLLDELERWEDARDLLGPLVDQTQDPGLLRRLETALNALRKKLGEG